ncbi:MAG: hypothetical protein DRJ50_09610 [Actinobacteria bacterium]|nr:MAG: hypothetical protein DRJ50_09610 [Actinomycetota bacterium]
MNNPLSFFARTPLVWLFLTLVLFGQNLAVGSPTQTISRSNLGGSNIVELVSVDNSLGGIALDTTAGKIYWTDVGPLAGGGYGPQYLDGRILRANLDGSDQEVLVTGLRDPRSIAVDPGGGKIYWTGWAPAKLKRANLDGTEVEVLVESPNSADGLALDTGEGLIYWSEFLHRLWRTTLDGTDSELLIYESNHFYKSISLDLGAGKMYWVQPVAPPTIRRANLDGSDIETILSDGLERPSALAIDSGGQKMYFADRSTQMVWRADLNGLNRDLLLSGFVTALALDLQSNHLYFIETVVPPTTVVPATSSRGLILLVSILAILASAVLLRRSRVHSRRVRR